MNISSVLLAGLFNVSKVNCRSPFEIGWQLFGVKGGDQTNCLSSFRKLTPACSPGGWAEDKVKAFKAAWGLGWSWPDASVFCLSSSVTEAAQIRGKDSTSRWEESQSHIVKTCSYRERNHCGRFCSVYHIFHRPEDTVYCYDYGFCYSFWFKKGILVDFNLFFYCYEWGGIYFSVSSIFMSLAHFSIRLSFFLSWFLARTFCILKMGHLSTI